MKKVLIFIAGSVAGAFLMTERGKRIVTWGRTKIQDQVNKIVNKVDEVTAVEPDSSVEAETPKEEVCDSRE
jgi:hypothetical protein